MAFSILLLAATLNILENPGFEVPSADGGAQGWQLAVPKFSRVSGGGRNGTCALVWDAVAPVRRQVTTNQRLRIRPGVRYRLEAWVRCENLEAGSHGATICVDWCDEHGKFLGEQFPVGVRGTVRDWQLVGVSLQRMPADAAFVSVMPAVERGTSGKAYFDDFRMVEDVPRAVQTLVSDVYRDAAEDGVVTFTAVLDLKSADIPPARAKGLFSLVQADGRRKTLPPDSLTEDRATLTVKVDSLQAAAQVVAFRLTDEKGEKKGDAGLRFERRTERTPRRVEVDRFGRTLVGGKPFFPLGFFNGGLSQGQMLKYWKGTPFNCVMPYSMPTVEDLDCARQNGFMALVSLKDAHYRTLHCPPEITSEQDEMAFVTNVVDRFKGHPALLAWYVNDESDVGMIGRLTKRRRQLERLDPDHPTWGCIYQLSEASEYVQTADIQGSDPYPIPGDISRVLTDTRRIADASRGARPLWQVPQVFDWSAYHKPPREGERAPTEEEIRNMSWQCIAGGANGLIYYAFHTVMLMDGKDPFERRWAEWCRVAEEIRSRFPILLAEPSPLAVLGAPAELGWRAWETGDATTLLLVNSTRAALNARLRLSVRFGGADLTWGGDVSREADGTLAVALKPLAVAIVRLDVLK